MGDQHFPEVYPHLYQRPQQWHQYPHEKQAGILYNTGNIYCLPHTSTLQNRTTKSEPKQKRTIT